MSLPPLPGPQGVPDTIYRWLGLLKTSFDKLSQRTNDIKETIDGYPEFLSVELINDLIAESQTLVWRKPFYESGGASNVSPREIWTETIPNVEVGDILEFSIDPWEISSTFTESIFQGDPTDIHTAFLRLYQNGTEVAEMGRFIHTSGGTYNDYDISGLGPSRYVIESPGTNVTFSLQIVRTNGNANATTTTYSMRGVARLYKQSSNEGEA